MEDLRDLRALLNRVTKRVETDGRKLEAKVDKLMKLPDLIDIENLMKNMVWAIDLADKDLWLSIWSDDINYTIPQSNIDIKGKKALKEFSESTIFTTEKKRFSTLMNIMIEVTGHTATARITLHTTDTPSTPRRARSTRSVLYQKVCSTINSAKGKMAAGKSRSSKSTYIAERSPSQKSNI